MARTRHPALQERTGYRLIKLGEALNTLAERALAPLGLKGRHLAVLTLITEHRLSQQDLALYTGLDRTTMVAIMDELEQRGLATRTRSDTDRRKYMIVPTAEAAATLAEAGRLLDVAERELFGDLGVQERARLDDVSSKLLAKARDSGAVPSWSPEV